MDESVLTLMTGLWENFVVQKFQAKSPEEVNNVWEKLLKLTDKELDEKVKEDEKFRMNLETAVIDFYFYFYFSRKFSQKDFFKKK